ncbi:hypothetical protein ACRAWF_18360 [Streptomyces sp. L7]
MVAVTQRGDPADLVSRVIKLGGDDALVGVGLVRPGLAGAEMSISDAERALVVAEQGGRATAFEDAWLRASLVDSRDRLLPSSRRSAGSRASSPNWPRPSSRSPTRRCRSRTPPTRSGSTPTPWPTGSASGTSSPAPTRAPSTACCAPSSASQADADCGIHREPPDHSMITPKTVHRPIPTLRS